MGCQFRIADEDALPGDVLAAVAGGHVVHADALTPPAVEAALALTGYAPLVQTIEMLARSAAASDRPLPAISLCAVATDDDWRTFDALVHADHAEGARTGVVDDTVAAGLLANMHRQSPPATYHLIAFEGVVVGYGLTAMCPGGLGLIENLFALPEWRGRGIMSAFIVAADRSLREAGCDGVFLDAHVHDTPKHLYARLGFAPVGVNRTWVRQKLR